MYLFHFKQCVILTLLSYYKSYILYNYGKIITPILLTSYCQSGFFTLFFINFSHHLKMLIFLSENFYTLCSLWSSNILHPRYNNVFPVGFFFWHSNTCTLLPPVVPLYSAHLFPVFVSLHPSFSSCMSPGLDSLLTLN